MGTARRFDRLAALENLRASATANVCVFRCQPCEARPVPVRVLERHPHTTQLFAPMTARRYLVVVARGGDRPDLSTLAAFVATGAEGVTYRPGVWHHPLIALDAACDFACVVFEDGSAADCDAIDLTGADAREIDPGDAIL